MYSYLITVPNCINLPNASLWTPIIHKLLKLLLLYRLIMSPKSRNGSYDRTTATRCLPCVCFWSVP
jgi:hypothetical protein